MHSENHHHLSGAADQLLATAERLEEAAAALRAMAAELAPEPCEPAVQGGGPDDWVDILTASERLGVPKDSMRWLAREKGYGEKRGSRWFVSMRETRRYFSKSARS